MKDDHEMHCLSLNGGPCNCDDLHCSLCGADLTTYDHETDTCGGCGRRLGQDDAPEDSQDEY